MPLLLSSCRQGQKEPAPKGGETPTKVALAVIKEVETGRVPGALAYWDFRAPTSAHFVRRDSRAQELDRWKRFAREWKNAEVKPFIESVSKEPDGVWVFIAWRQKKASREPIDHLALVTRRVGGQWRVAGMGIISD